MGDFVGMALADRVKVVDAHWQLMDSVLYGGSTNSDFRVDFATQPYDDNVHLIGGARTTNSSGLTLHEVFDSITDTLSQKANIPSAYGNPGWGEIDGIIYLSTGWDGSRHSRTYSYDPVTNTWTQRANNPLGRVNVGSCTADGLLHTWGGYTAAGSNTNVHHAYDPETNSWSIKANFPMSAQINYGQAFYKGKIYSVGAKNTNSPWLYAYDVSMNSWEEFYTGELPRSDIRQASYWIYKDKIYVYGGLSPNDQAVHYYDITEGKWMVSVSGRPRQAHGFCELNGRFYGFGGYGGNNLIDMLVPGRLDGLDALKAYLATK